MIWRVRRVLTGHDAAGRSAFIADGEAVNVKESPAMPGLALTEEDRAEPHHRGALLDGPFEIVRHPHRQVLGPEPLEQSDPLVAQHSRRGHAVRCIPLEHASACTS